MKTYEVVIGATRKAFTVPIIDGFGSAIPLYGATALLEGWSKDLPAVVLYHEGVVTDPAGGVVTFYGLGGLVTPEQVGDKPTATFVCRVRWSDVDGTDYTEEFALRYVAMPAIFDYEGVGLMMNTNSLVRYYNFATAPTPIRNTLTNPVVSALPPALRVQTAGVAAENNKLWEAGLEFAPYPDGGGVPTPGATILFYDHPIGLWGEMCGESADRARTPSGWVAIELGSAANSTFSSLNANQGCIQLRQSLGDYTQWTLVSFRGLNDVANSTSVPFTVPLVNVNGPSPGVPNPDYREGHHVGLVYDPWKEKAYAWVDGVMRATVSTEGAKLPVFFANDGLAVGVLMYTGAQSQAVVAAGWWAALRVESTGVNAIGCGNV